jgi:fumarate reductase subunit C
MTTRKPYIRSMQGWWLKDVFYRKYMIREATSVFVAIYALILLEGLMALASGVDAWNEWLASMRSPWLVLFHLLALAAAVYHTITWFAVSPKLVPIMIIGRHRLPALAVTVVQYVIAVIVYIILLWMAVSV